MILFSFITKYRAQVAFLEEWLRKGNPSPWDALQTAKNLTTEVAMSTHKLPNIHWDESGENFLVKGTSGSMQGIRKIYQSQLDQAKALFKDLMEGMETPFDFQKLGENFQEHREDYNFFSKNSSYFNQLGSSLIFHFGTMKSQRYMEFSGNTINFHIVPVQQWLNKASLLNRLLLLLWHISSGQPARGTEICVQMFRNHLNTPRNLFWTLKGLASVNLYNKVRTLCGIRGHSIDYMALNSDILNQEKGCADSAIPTKGSRGLDAPLLSVLQAGRRAILPRGLEEQGGGQSAPLQPLASRRTALGYRPSIQGSIRDHQRTFCNRHECLHMETNDGRYWQKA
jgi:hypothetical protein